MIFYAQTMFMMIAVTMFVMAQGLMRHFGHADHRPWVLALAPLIFIGGDALHNYRLVQWFGTIYQWLGLIYSLIILPAIYLLARRRKQKKHEQNVCSKMD